MDEACSVSPTAKRRANQVAFGLCGTGIQQPTTPQSLQTCVECGKETIGGFGCLIARLFTRPPRLAAARPDPRPPAALPCSARARLRPARAPADGRPAPLRAPAD